MNPQIEALIAPFKNVETILDSVSDKSQVAELEKTYNELMELADKHENDFMGFMTKTTEKNIFGKLSQEMQKANQIIQKQQSDPKTKKVMGKEEIKKMYERLYEDTKAKPFMTETCKAYEELLSASEKFSDLGGWLSYAYESGIMRKLEIMPQYDSAKLKFDKIEPNEIFERKAAQTNMKIAAEAKSKDQNTYLNLKNQHINLNDEYKDAFIRDYITKFTEDIRNYDIMKKETAFVADKRPDALLMLQNLKDHIAKKYSFIKKYFMLDWDKIVENKRFIKDILKFNEELNGYIWFGAGKENLDFYKEILFEEILNQDITIVDILKRVPTNKFSEIPKAQDIENHKLYDKMFEKVEQTGENLYWADYDIDIIKKKFEEEIEHMKKYKIRKRKSSKIGDRAKVLADTVKTEIGAKIKGAARRQIY